MDKKIQFCKRCLYSSLHPLGITFDKDGICSGCRIHEEKDHLDWSFRFSKLKKIANEYKSKKGYDCIVPVTGSQDSYFTVHVVKNLLKLNPLLVNYNKYFNTHLGIKNLANLRIKFNCHTIFKNVNPLSVKKITQLTLKNYGSVYWHCLAGHTVFPVQTSVKMKIPLIIWGEHQGLQQVGMFSHKHEVEMTRRYRKDHDLMGIEADDLIEPSSIITEGDIYNYRYPSVEELNSVGVRGIYLGNFMRWDPIAQHRKMIKLYNYKTSKLVRTFDCYDNVDSYVYMGIHDILKFYKHGYSKVTDHVCREIRYKRLTRSTGIKLIKKHEFEKDIHQKLFLKWLNIREKALKFILNEKRNPNFWHENEPNKWTFRGNSSLFYKDKNYTKVLKKKNKLNFIINSSLNNKKKDQYIIFGRGI